MHVHTEDARGILRAHVHQAHRTLGDMVRVLGCQRCPCSGMANGLPHLFLPHRLP